MIPFIQKEAVEINKWITLQDFIDIVTVDAVTPGPIAVNLATFVGYKVYGVPGAIVATFGVVLPSLVLVTIIAAFFYNFRNNNIVQAILNGLKPAIVALIAAAIYSLIQNKAIFDFTSFLIALIVFVAVAILNTHPIWMIAFSGLAGLAVYWR